MNKQELIEKIRNLDKLYGEKFYVSLDDVLYLVKRLDEHEAGHAEEAPRYVKNILARLRELPLHDREVWLKAIMGEFEQDFSHVKWREGYEQGKFEGEWVSQQLKNADKIRRELNQVKIPQFVANWIEHCKINGICLGHALYCSGEAKDKRVYCWVVKDLSHQETFARAWLDGYEVEEEPKYTVMLKGISGYGRYLNKALLSEEYFFASENEVSGYRTKHTRKELEEANFGWVFDCPGIEIEEVTE